MTSPAGGASVQPASDAPSTSAAPRRHWTRGAVLLAAGTTAAHLLSYATSLVLSRSLGPAGYGALGALLGLGVVVSVPATALQTQVARATVEGGHVDALRRGVRMGALLGAAQLLLAVVAAPALRVVLHLDSGWEVVALGLGFAPLSVVGACLGVLLGAERFRLLALATASVAVLRFAAGCLAALSGANVLQALLWTALACWLGVALVLPLARRVVDGTGSGEAGDDPRWSSVLVATAGLLGLYVLANLDVLLARAYLSSEASGLYAFAALASKAMFWGTQFLALLVVPAAARSRSAVPLLRATVVVLALGVVGGLVSWVLGPRLVDLLAGPAYAAAGPALPAFVALGTGLALVQLLVYSGVAQDDRRATVVVWAGVILLVLGVVLRHESVAQVVVVALIAVWSVVAVSFARLAAGAAVKRADR